VTTSRSTHIDLFGWVMNSQVQRNDPAALLLSASCRVFPGDRWQDAALWTRSASGRLQAWDAEGQLLELLVTLFCFGHITRDLTPFKYLVTAVKAGGVSKGAANENSQQLSLLPGGMAAMHPGQRPLLVLLL
jgi:hypothetical protein